jgi:hypothetical protein
VAVHARAGDYTSDTRRTSLGGPRPPATERPSGPRPAARPADAAAVDEFLLLLARAIQQFHTYPPTSQICLAAIDTCQRALLALENREQLVFRVMPREVIVDEVAVGSGTVVEHELARRLHGASIAQVTIERGASSRELARFCFDLIQCDPRLGLQQNFVDLLEQHGVSRIALRASYRPQVVEVGAPSVPLASLIADQRARREEVLALGGPVDHLYPPDKGWVRIDPTAHYDQVSLTDLALLTQDPATLAGMLLRLTEDDVNPGEISGEEALSRKFSDVATLFSALDPRVSRVMFGKLARAVLDLQPEQRQSLLRKTILPGLLDGRIDGNVLHDFPDVDLAESLCLLLDLETAAPEVVTTALARLDLTAERHAAVLPLVQSRVDAKRGPNRPDAGLDAHARKLTRIDRERARSFAEFAAFDLALDPATVSTLDGIRDAIGASDILAVQLECVLHLIKLQPNPEQVQRFIDRATPLLEALEGEQRWEELAGWLSALKNLSASFAETRPDVAEVLTSGLGSFCTVYRAARLVELAGRDAAGRTAAGAIVEALGPGAGPALLDAVRSDNADAKGARAAIQLLCDHAPLVAPALAATADVNNGSPVPQRAVARVLGFAGHGYEVALGKLLDSPDEQTVREALRSLARIGSGRAAALVAGQIVKNRGWIGAAAEETLWHFQRPETDRQIRDLLARREFVLRLPQVAARVLERAAHNGTANLAPILQPLVPLRYRFWNPALVRVARQARTMLAQS